MNSEEAAKLLGELGIDPLKRITVDMTMRDSLMLNELLSAAQAWREDTDPDEGTPGARLATAIDAYNVAESQAAQGSD